jgi:HPt (histidine-containing phosphotransfer) domain-containing protein
MQALHIAFNRPESRPRLSPSKARPVDLVHLARQTMGNKELEEEVLRLFARQARQCLQTLVNADLVERGRVAHMLKGSARGVGAFSVADHAELLEMSPHDEGAVAALSQAVVDVENFLLRLTR